MTNRQTRRLHLERDEDVTGVSGTGRVAFGAMFPDGTIVLRWDTEVRSTVFYDSLGDLEHIVGHGGRTKVVFDDAEEPKLTLYKVDDLTLILAAAIEAAGGEVTIPSSVLVNPPAWTLTKRYDSATRTTVFQVTRDEKTAA